MQIRHQWQSQTFFLHPHRMMYWEEKQTLIASDLHLGKSGHFRKSGIAVPQHMFREDLMRLFAGIQQFAPKRLVVVGDLVHSTANRELNMFLKWRNDIASLPITLIKGNHDILPDAWYKEAQITLVNEHSEHGITFTHDPNDCNKEQATICGHIHPGIRIGGAARQSLRFPCFYFGEHICILPAFGQFTGLHSIKPQKKDNIFAITNNALIKL